MTERLSRGFTVHHFDREHKKRLSEYPEGFIPKDKRHYDIHVGLDEMNESLLNNLIDQLPDDFFIADPDTKKSRQRNSLVRAIERIGGHGLLITTLDILSACSDVSEGKTRNASLGLSARLFFPQAMVLPRREDFFARYKAMPQFQGIATVKAIGQLEDLPMTMILPTSDPIEAAKIHAFYREIIPLVEVIADTSITDPDEYVEQKTQAAMKVPGSYEISLPFANLATRHDALLNALRYGKDLFPSLVTATRILGQEICSQNNLDPKITNTITLSGLLPIPIGVYSNDNIANYFNHVH